MKKALSWRIGAVQELADLLADAELSQSRAAGACTIYQFRSGNQDMLAITVGHQQVVFIDTQSPAGLGRRNGDPDADPQQLRQHEAQAAETAGANSSASGIEGA